MNDNPHTKPNISAAQYIAAFVQLNCVAHTYVAMLQTHRYAAAMDVTTIELAHAVGYRNFNAANLNYGKLGGYLGKILGLPVESRVNTLVTMYKDKSQWHWVMRPEVADALAQVEWQPCSRGKHMVAKRK
jgi:5-methylcytosine-specific restriction protein A